MSITAYFDRRIFIGFWHNYLTFNAKLFYNSLILKGKKMKILS